MSQTQYAFIIKAPGYRPAQHRAQMQSPAFHAQFVGVEDIDTALAAAEALVAAGVEVIELCGGFSAQETARLRRRFAHVAIGRVTYP